MTSAEFLVQRVKQYGWLSVGHIFCDNGYNINPFTSGGEVCVSPGNEMLLCAATYDSSDTANLEKYIVGNPKYAGMQKTIVCIDFGQIQHFDINLFAQDIVWSQVKDSYPIPTLPTPAEMEAITLDENGLAASEDVGERMDRGLIAVHTIYPDLDILNVTGLRVKAYQDFQAKHNLFVEAMKKLTGFGDCI